MGCTVLRGAREMTAATDVGTRVAEFDDDFVGKFLREPARVRHSRVGHLWSTSRRCDHPRDWL